MCCLLVALAAPIVSAQEPRRTENVILVVADGMRWQEVFGGADSAILFGDAHATGVRTRYWRATAEERRAALMPFVWSTIARDGQLFGNRVAGSSVRVTNRLKFSYPGYHEMLVGFVDPRIDHNRYGPNPNRTVFEWLNRQPGFTGRVAAFGTWKTFHDIFGRARSGIGLHFWDHPSLDSVMQDSALAFLANRRPRVLFIGHGETDALAHTGRYDRYLEAAHAVDADLRELWAAVESHPDYRGRTTLLVTTDHGRGRTARDWSRHGWRTRGADETWLLVIGPDTPALGERRNAAPVTTSQIAATIAAILGHDYRASVRRAAPPITVSK